MRWVDPKVRLLEKVRKDPSGCWEWTAARNEDGYGQLRFKGSMRGAHKCAYELLIGPVPSGLCVRHTCDNPGCVNPEHLILGTQKDNVGDCIARGRFSIQRGSKAGMSKLTETHIPAIRGMLSSGMFQQDVADAYGVDQTTISKIATGRTWAHVP